MRRVGVLVGTTIAMFGAIAGFSEVNSSEVEKTVLRSDSSQVKQVSPSILSLEEQCSFLYDSLQLRELGLSKEAFRYAWFGFQQANFEKPILAIADFSQSANNKRLYVIDFAENKLIYHTYVAHGRNSGQEYARKFSNVTSSYQSSLGFYRALSTYQGKHGLSLKLEGLERNINDRAFDRAIVMHGADYVSEDFIRQHGRLGRSLGCPAVPVEDHQKVISLLNGGAALFLYYPDAAYLSKSPILQKALAQRQETGASSSYTSSK